MLARGTRGDAMTVWLAALHGPAAACGGLATSAESLAVSDAMEALFEVGAGEVRVSYDVKYHGNAADLGWVIPVPGDVSAVADGDPERLEEVRFQSQPSVVTEYASEDSSGCSSPLACGGGSKGGNSRSLDGGTQGDGLTVLDQGFTGTYEYLVIAATDAGDLEAWFTEHGWTGIANDDLQHYVQQGWNFAALRVVPGAAEGEQRALPPVRITYAGDQLAFPAVMARHSSAIEQRTTLYVVGDSRAILTGEWLQDDSRGPLDGTLADDPQALWDDHLEGLGAGQAYSRTYAGFFDGDRFLTRFDTLAPTSVHDADVELDFEADQGDIHTVITLVEAGGSEATIALGLLLALVGARRRSLTRA
jgi:hypothetical protein